MTPAPTIIERLGGNLAVANFLGLERTAVQRWGYEPPKGTGGRIPSKYWSRLLNMAAQAGQPLTLAELDEELAEAAALTQDAA